VFENNRVKGDAENIKLINKEIPHIQVSAVLRGDVASLGILFPTFQVYLVVSVSRIEIRKNKGQESNTQ
jgi:hypothetical protein